MNKARLLNLWVSGLLTDVKIPQLDETPKRKVKQKHMKSDDPPKIKPKHHSRRIKN